MVRQEWLLLGYYLKQMSRRIENPEVPWLEPQGKFALSWVWNSFLSLSFLSSTAFPKMPPLKPFVRQDPR